MTTSIRGFFWSVVSGICTRTGWNSSTSGDMARILPNHYARWYLSWNLPDIINTTILFTACWAIEYLVSGITTSQWSGILTVTSDMPILSAACAFGYMELGSRITWSHRICSLAIIWVVTIIICATLATSCLGYWIFGEQNYYIAEEL